jgi:hypothetical protein
MPTTIERGFCRRSRVITQAVFSEVFWPMERNSLLIFVGLLFVAAAILFQADNGRYAFSHASERLTYAKLDTCTGEAWLCGAWGSLL